MSAINLQKDEKVILRARRHWFVLFSQSFVFLLALIIPLGFLGLLKAQSSVIGISIDQLNVIVSFYFAAWTFLIFLIFSILFTNYYLDILIITNKRIIDVEQLGLFARDVAIAPMENIEDIKIEVIGFIPTMLGYGTLHVQTAASNREITIEGIVRPYKVKEAIVAMQDSISTASRRRF